MTKLKIGMLLFPDLTLMDFVGPYDVFVRAHCFEVIIVSETTSIIKTEGGLSLKADVTLEECPPVDILFVPGGKGISYSLIKAISIFLNVKEKMRNT